MGTRWRARARLLQGVLAATAALASLAVADRNAAGRSLGAAERAMPAREGYVSSTQSDATLAGIQMLQLGGNAADAATAVQFALAVTQPQSTGIGGGCSRGP